MLALVEQVVFDASDHSGRLGRDLAGDGHHAFQQGLTVGVVGVDQAGGCSFGGKHFTAGKGQFGDEARLKDKGETLQRTDVGYNAEVDLFDGKVGIFGAVADVTGGDDVYPAADAPSVDGGQDRFAAAFNGGDAFLEVFDKGDQVALRLFRGGSQAGLEAAEDGQVHPRTEVLTFPGKDDAVNIVISICGDKGFAQGGPVRFVEGVGALGVGKSQQGDVVGDRYVHTV